MFKKFLAAVFGSIFLISSGFIFAAQLNKHQTKQMAKIEKQIKYQSKKYTETKSVVKKTKSVHAKNYKKMPAPKIGGGR